MRRFRVFLRYPSEQIKTEEAFVDLPDDVDSRHVDEVCADILDNMIRYGVARSDEGAVMDVYYCGGCCRPLRVCACPKPAGTETVLDVAKMREELLTEIDLTLQESGYWVGGRLDTIKRLIAMAQELEDLHARLREWTDTYGAALILPGADTYGEGVRDCKAQIRALCAYETTSNAGLCMDIAPGRVAACVPPGKDVRLRTPWCHLPKGHEGPHVCGEHRWR